jgi:hypothetical protein
MNKFLDLRTGYIVLVDSSVDQKTLPIRLTKFDPNLYSYQGLPELNLIQWKSEIYAPVSQQSSKL